MGRKVQGEEVTRETMGLRLLSKEGVLSLFFQIFLTFVTSFARGCPITLFSYLSSLNELQVA